MKLKDKIAIVTGAASGLGLAGALRFASEGAKVIVSDINDDQGNKTVTQIESMGGIASFFHCDIGNSEEIKKLIQYTVQTYGRLNILYNNAGTPGPRGSCIEIDEEEWDRTEAINLRGTYLCCMYAIPELIKQPGSAIINTASLAVLIRGLPIDFPQMQAYAVSKAGLLGMTRWMAAKYGAYGLRVNVICPGYIESQMTAPLLASSELTGAIKSITPLGRIGLAGEVASVATFLASDEASWVTGVILPIDGGITAVE
jgi:NAD(P)-dependent dehydrogenase (short-subunit alcohol dehydrogenase family)